MRIYTTNYIKRPRKAFWSVCVAFLILSFLLFGFVPERALASNVYLDDVVFYQDSNGYNKVSFHVLTTFNLYVYSYSTPALCRVQNQANTTVGRAGDVNGIKIEPEYFILSSMLTGSSSCAGTYTMTAGNTYDGFLTTSETWTASCDNYSCLSLPNKLVYTSSDYWEFDLTDWITRNDAFPTAVSNDTEHYYFVEYPTLTITFPEDDDEITGTFYIEGSFTQPDPPTYAHWLQAIATPAGVLAEYPNAFYWPTNDATSSAFEIWISGLSAGYYDFYIYMKDLSGDFYPAGISSWVVSNIHIVNDQPFSLPPYAEQPPYTAPSVFETLDPITYYTANSGYETSTAFYTTFTDIFAPVLLALGQNLMAYSANFTPSNASSTGNQMGEAVVLMRSYLSNLNSFFNNLPISQFLVLYLIALVLVVVIRLIKGLFNFFKPV